MSGPPAPSSGSAPLALLQVGTGGWGKSWPGIVAASPDWTIAGLVDVDASALARVGEGSGVPPGRRFARLADALDAVPSDAVLVAVPPEAHLEVTLAALAAGRHCLVEKPLAPSLGDGARIAAAAGDRVVMASQNYRFLRGAATVRRLVAEGAVGSVEAATIGFARTPPLLGFRLELDEPLLLDGAIHHVDLVRDVLALEPDAVAATTFNPSWSPFAGNACGTLELVAGEATVAYRGSWAPRGPETSWEGHWLIEGVRGALAWHGDSVVLHGTAPPSSTLPARVRRRARRTLGRSVEHATRVPLDPLAASDRAGVLAELADAIRSGREPRASAADNLRTLAIVEAAVTSARTGCRVRVSAAPV